MRLINILTSLESVKSKARMYEKDMWYEESVTEHLFREIADDIESIIKETEDVVSRLESCEDTVSLIT